MAHPLTDDGSVTIEPCDNCNCMDGYVDGDGKIRCECCDTVQYDY